MHPTRVYLRMKKRVWARPHQLITIGDVAHVLVDESYQKIEQLDLYQLTPSDGNLIVIDLMDVIKRIKEYHPELDIRNVGPPQSIVELKFSRKKTPVIYVFFIWVLLFLGSGLAIMNFHADVSMPKVLARIFYLITGEVNHRPLLLQIPYSLGIGAGMILFFNHIFKHRFNDEPSPLELEVFLYQESIDQYVIDHEKKEDTHGPLP